MPLMSHRDLVRRASIQQGLLWCVMCMVCFVGCADPDGPNLLPSQQAVCDGGLGLASITIEPQIGVIGPSSNVITRFDDALWIVESGSNTISRYVLKTGTLDSTFLDVGNDQNPYDVAADDDRVYVTNYLGQSVSVFDRQSTTLIREIKHESLRNPAGVAVLDGRLYVSNVNFTNSIEGYGPATVSVFDVADGSWIGTLPLQEKNAQFLETVEINGSPRLVVVNTGSIVFEQEGAVINTPGSVELWTPTDDVLSPERQRYVLPVQENDRRLGGPGKPMLASDGGALYFSSATSAVLFKLDLVSGQWSAGAENPLRFAKTSGDALHHGVMDARGLIWITSFNEDALYVWDTRCDRVLAGPISLGVDDNMLEGPHGVSFRQTPTGVDLYYIMTLANTLGRVRIAYEESQGD